MKKPMFKRLTALLLALTFVFGGGAISAVASESTGNGGSVSDTTLEDIRELLNAKTYEEYIKGDTYVAASKGDREIVIDGIDFNADKTTAKVQTVKIDPETGKAIVVEAGYQAKDGEIVGVYTPSTGEITFNVNVDKTSKYGIKIEYYPVTELVEGGATLEADKAASIERILKINGQVPFAEARYLTLSKVWKSIYKINMITESTTVDKDGNTVKKYKDITPYTEAAERSGLKYSVPEDKSYIIIYLPEGGWTKEIIDGMTASDLRLFSADIDKNEIRPGMERVPEWRVYDCKDVDGFYTESFEFLFNQGENTISLEAKNQAMVIKSVTLYPREDRQSYKDALAGYQDKGYQSGSGSLKFEAEYIFASSSQTVYPLEDASSALTSPANTTYTVLNTIGGEKWQTSGQWIRYQFTVDKDGLYNIVARYRQNINDGMFSSRALHLYSGDGIAEGEDGYYNGIPYAEATSLRFDYSTDWKVGPLSYAEKTTNDKGEAKWTNVPMQFYFKEGVTYTMELEVSLGDMGSLVNQVSQSLSNINTYYLNILKLTGADPDEYRDYGFYRIMPDTMKGLLDEAKRLENIGNELKQIAGSTSSNVATLEKVVWLLREMGGNEDNVARYLDQLKSYIGTLGTWISTAKTQPLDLDFFMIQSAESELPRANANFFEALWHEICRFFQSFFRNFNRMGATVSDSQGGKSVEVWLAYGRDQTQVIRNLINNQFTPETGNLVDLKLVNGGALLPSILAGSGPDVYIGISEDNIINYAIRGALLNIENYEGFYDMTSQYVMVNKTINDLIAEYKAQNYDVTGEGTAKVVAGSADGVAMHTVTYSSDGSGKVTDKNGKVEYQFNAKGELYRTGSNFSGATYVYKYATDENGNKIENKNAQFNDAAMYVLGLEDSEKIMHYYGLPETQNFSMMFVRNDVLADLGLDIPKTWDDVEAAIPVLQSNNMQIAMSNDYKLFLYQQGGELFADEGMRINLDSNVALESFTKMCNLFTMYSFPYKFDFANRFRTGEVPIGIASYNATYNQLVVFATEIRGKWSFYPIPGEATYATDEFGNFIYEDGKKVVESINNQAVSTVTAIGMMNGCDQQQAAWEFMKWYVGEDCQVNYSNEMVAILGDSAKHPTANIKALESMPWTTAEYLQLALQFENLASIPNYPGSYIIGRYTQFAFLAAYDDLKNPADEMLSYINTINSEITRKREEFDLEVLEKGQKTLADKRMSEVKSMLDKLDGNAKNTYKTEIDAILAAISDISTSDAVSDADIAEIFAASVGARMTKYSAFFEIADVLDEVCELLVEYQAYY